MCERRGAVSGLSESSEGGIVLGSKTGHRMLRTYQGLRSSSVAEFEYDTVCWRWMPASGLLRARS